MVVRHEWGVLCTASAAFSHRTQFRGLQFKAEARKHFIHTI